jgi:diguanylate cyclase (GGDEF)-like protein
MTHTARTIVRVALIVTAVVLGPVIVAHAQPTEPFEPSAASEARRVGWSLVRPMPLVTLQIRKVVGFVMLVPAGTMFLLYLFRPRPYVLAGAFTWAAGSAMLLAVSYDSGGPHPTDQPDTIAVGRAGVMAWSLAALAFGVGLRSAALWFRDAAVISRGMLWTIGLAVAWIILASAYATRPGTALLPAFALMCLFHGKSAMVYARIARGYRFVGAALAGLGVTGVIGVNFSALAVAVVNRAVSQASTNVAYLNFVCASLLALGMHLLIFEDLIEELRRAAGELAKGRDEMKAMAVTDPLTKCYNRRMLDEVAEHELEQHRRYKLPLSLLYIDIDHFKAINDQRGHLVGDEVLKTLGAILNELTRQADFVFRWGGDEFLVLLSASETEAKNKANQIRTAFLESVIVRNLPDGVDLSIGIVPVPPETRDLDPLIDQADKEMYRRKRALGS